VETEILLAVEGDDLIDWFTSLHGGIYLE